MGRVGLLKNEKNVAKGYKRQKVMDGHNLPGNEAYGTQKNQLTDRLEAYVSQKKKMTDRLKTSTTQKKMTECSEAYCTQNNKLTDRLEAYSIQKKINGRLEVYDTS